MTTFTDEQLLEAATVYAATVLRLHTGPYGPSYDFIRTHIETAPTTQKEQAIKAMQAALHTLDPISIHEPQEVTSNGEQVTVCKACVEIEARVLDTYAPNDPYEQSIWPCPVAQAHEKENKNAH